MQAVSPPKISNSQHPLAVMKPKRTVRRRYMRFFKKLNLLTRALQQSALSGGEVQRTKLFTSGLALAITSKYKSTGI